MEAKEKEVTGGYLEITYTLPRSEARKAARKYLDRYPKYGYDTHVANWHVTQMAKFISLCADYLRVTELRMNKKFSFPSVP